MYLRIGFGLSALALGSAAWASETPLYRPAPEWVVAAPAIDPARPSGGDAMMVLFDQQQRLADGARWTYIDMATRAVSAEMLTPMGTVTLPWHPTKGDLIIHRAQILRGAETIDLIAKGAKFTVLQREQQLERQALTGVLSATMAIEGLRIGDIVRMTFSITANDPALGGRVEASTVLPSEPVRAQFGRVRFLWPAGSKMAFKGHGTLPPLKPVRNGDYQEIVLPVPLAKQPEMPGDAPTRFTKPPILEASSFASWEDVSRTSAPLYRVEGQIQAGSALAAEVAKIAAADADPRRRAAAALRLVQDQVRYLFRGMDQGNYQPQTAAQTWELRYGDCKAKTLLLLSILAGLGIKAEPVYASVQLSDWVPERLPSFGAFDHVIVRAEIEGKPLWLDGTGSGSRYEDLDDVPPLRVVLPIRAEGAGLLPLMPRAKARPDMVVDLELDQSAGIAFPPLFKLSLTARGQMADLLRMTSAQAGEEGLKDAVNGFLGSYVNDGATVSRSVTFDDANGTAKIVASGMGNLSWSKEDERSQVVLDKAMSWINFEPDRSRPAWQAIPVTVTQFPGQQVRTRLHLPDGGKGFELQGATKLADTLAGLEISRTANIDKGWVTVEERIMPRETEIPAAAIALTRERVATAKANPFKVVAPTAYPPRWKQVQSAKAAGLFEPLLAMYKKGIEDDPEEVHPYRNRAQFLAGIYEHRKAIGDVDQLIRLAPDAATYAWRAGLYEALGERPKAIADLETARTLDPGSADIVRQLALVLGEAGRGEQGLKLVEDRILTGGSEKQSYLSVKAELLGELGRVDEAIKTLDTAIATSPGSPALLNGRCWLKGTRNVMLDSALKDCTKAIELMESPAAALDSRAMVYFRMGRTEEALADLEAAYAINPQIPAVMFMRGVIRANAGDKAGAATDLAAARLIVPRIDEQYARFGIKP